MVQNCAVSFIKIHSLILLFNKIIYTLSNGVDITERTTDITRTVCLHLLHWGGGAIK